MTGGEDRRGGQGPRGNMYMFCVSCTYSHYLAFNSLISKYGQGGTPIQGLAGGALIQGLTGGTLHQELAEGALIQRLAGGALIQ